MRLIVDATAVREDGGGLSTYATALMKAWSVTFPEDDLVVVAGDHGGARIMRAVTADVRVSTFGRSRFIAQHGLIPVLTRKVRPDAIFSLVPGVPLVPLAVPIVSVVHDLRSWMHPDEFPIWVRTYRRTAYHYAFHRSARIVTVSKRSRSDLRQVCRRGALKAHVLYPGADHVDEWPSHPRATHVITFGHWSNKKPGLAIQAWARALRTTGPKVGWKLHVVGVPDKGRGHLINSAAALGVMDSVLVHGYLPDLEYQRLFTSASAVLMLSTFEGFGLPVVEAMRQGIHVIASRDAALQEAGGSSVVYIDDEAGLSQALLAVMVDHPEVQLMVQSGLLRTRDMTWASTATDARALIQGAIAQEPTAGSGGPSVPARGSGQ